MTFRYRNTITTTPLRKAIRDLHPGLSYRPVVIRHAAVTGLVVCTVLMTACNIQGIEQDLKTQRTEAVAEDAALLGRGQSLSAGDLQTMVYAEALMATELQAQLAAPRSKRRMTTTNSPDAVLNVAYDETYADLTDNNTVIAKDDPVSTFSIDVDTGAYSNVRRFLNNGQLPPKDAVRVEELLNYFNYDYELSATTAQPFSVSTEIGPTPWNTSTRLLHIGLQGYVPQDTEDQPVNLVFLIDVSGSMNNPDKLGLLKSSISLMVGELDENDTVSMVVYAGSSGTVLEPTPGNEHRRIRRALSKLTAGGSTNGAQGIELAYQLAIDNFTSEGTNRVILATDGDFNVGTSDVASLVDMIERKRQSGVALTTLGFGMGNYNDHLMEQLADAGDGHYAYIDTLGEARKVLVNELASTLVTIAKDVKVQIEFNPAIVAEYRLIGYTNRILNNEDFTDDKVDAGEIGAGHNVTALYEVALVDEGGERHTPRRYDAQSDKSRNTMLNELAELRLRYKLPGKKSSDSISRIIPRPPNKQEISKSSENFRLAASVAGFGQLLRGDTRVQNFSYTQAHALASSVTASDTFGYRAEYLKLLDLANNLDSMARASYGIDDSQG